MTEHPSMDISLWPYDELRLSCGQTPDEFQLDAPWVSLRIHAAPADTQRLTALAQKFESSTLSPSDLADLNWLLQPLAQFPFAYYLPRPISAISGTDRHTLADESLASATPGEFLERTLAIAPTTVDSTVASDTLSAWNWPHAQALAFSRVDSLEARYDPFSLFSIARRFSLVEAAAQSHSQLLFEQIEKLKAEPARYQDACAQIVRQNHFVTEQCQASLLPALETAQGVRGEVQDFIQAEYGHDRLLARAVESLGRKPDSIEVMPSCRRLMALLKLSGTRNFLAFALAVDIFERTSYGERDPLASLLDAGGLGHAAKQVDLHKGINDSGGHENVALSFLAGMAPVDESYAREALFFAEMIAFLVQQISREVSAKLSTG